MLRLTCVFTFTMVIAAPATTASPLSVTRPVTDARSPWAYACEVQNRANTDNHNESTVAHHGYSSYSHSDSAQVLINLTTWMLSCCRHLGG